MKLGIRVCFDPGTLTKPSKISFENNRSRFSVEGSLGTFTVDINVDDAAIPLLRYTTKLRPAKDIKLEISPRDICVLNNKFEPVTTPASVYVQQAGPTAGLVYFSVQAPAATIFYFQNLSALSQFSDLAHADPSGSVDVQWPELGFALPKSERPLEKGRVVTLSDAFLTIQEMRPVTELEIAESFLASVSRVYTFITKPDARFFNWPSAATKTLKALSSKNCRRRIKGHSFLNAYVGSTEKPPESMVQLAALLPMLEYQKWSGTKLRLADELLAGMPSFFDKKLGMMMRWLPGTAFGEEADSEEEDHGTMDSWYFFHTLLNVARLAELGFPIGRQLLFPSLEYAIKQAHHFKYQWPVFFDPKTFAVIKAETKPGEGGEQDVPGLYTHVMLQAYELTRDLRYLEEAERAAARIEGLGFKLLYQTNNTIMSAIALTKLWKVTANRRYLDLGTICIANVIARMWIWNGKYGFAKEYDTFMGVAPLQDAEYVAAYEEHEFFAAVVNYLKTAGSEISQPVDLLLSEYAKYLLHRGRFYFCEELPAEAIATDPKEGKIERGLFVPLEDLRTGWSQSGQVGQEVYGSAAAFILTSYAFINMANVPFLVHAQYPLLHFDYRLLARSGELLISVSGKGGECGVFIIAKGASLPQLTLMSEATHRVIKPRTGGVLEFQVKGGERYKITWALPKSKRRTRK